MLIHSVALVSPNVVSNTSLFKRTARSLCAPMMMSVPQRQHPNHCLWKHVSYIQGQFPKPGGLQWYARVNLYQIMRTNHMYLFPTPCTMTSGWQLKTGHGGNIHIMEIGKYYESDFFFGREDLVVEHLPAHHWLYMVLRVSLGKQTKFSNYPLLLVPPPLPG